MLALRISLSLPPSFHQLLSPILYSTQSAPQRIPFIHSILKMSTTAQLTPAPVAIVEGNEELEADTNSAYGTSVLSGSTSIRPSILVGREENGRRYQVTRNIVNNIPIDDKQWRSMEVSRNFNRQKSVLAHIKVGHLMYRILESNQPNPFFRAPISNSAQHIIDIKTSKGDWAVDVADRNPSSPSSPYS